MEKPSAVEVRKRLGTGSYTTITAALKEWVEPEASDGDELAPVPAEFEDRIVQAGADLFAIAMRIAGEQFQAERDAWAAERAQIEAERDEAIRLADAVTADLDEMRETVRRLQAENAAKLLERAHWMQSLLLDRIQLISHNRREIQRLADEGRIYATPHWRAGKYLHLIHSSQDGERVREYIGAAPARVAEALKKVENAKSHDALEAETTRIERTLDAVHYQLESMIRDLERLAPLDLVTAAAAPGAKLSPSAAVDGDSGARPGRESVTNGLDSALVTKPAIEQLHLSPI